MKHDCARHIHELDDLLDGRLDDRQRSELDTHLGECAGCRTELEAAVSLRAAARELPRAIAPSRDLWQGVAARIEAQTDRTVVDLTARRASRDRVIRWAPLAAAAMLLVVLSSGLTTMLLRNGPVGSATTPRVARGTGPTVTPATLAAFHPAEQEYQETVASLEEELEARRESLAPETVEVIERNLAIIDAAIAEARAALAADPTSADLPLHLSDIYSRKVDLLTSAIQLQT